jgi:hypothetical protein
MGAACGTHGDGKPRRSWNDNINMDLGERGWGDMNWIDLAQDRDQ